MSSSHGQKVTTDPETLNDPKTENPGIVTSDSLAAESINEGGSFAATSDSRGPMSQPSSSLTANTTDTSSATRLDPAVDAEARQVSEEWKESAALNSGLGPKGYAGEHEQDEHFTEYGVADGSNYHEEYVEGQEPAEVGPAPGSQEGFGGGEFKPKGKNLTEGGFDGSEPNYSGTTDIGGSNDPGRVALGRMEEANTPYAGGAGPRDQEVTGGQYDVLKDASS